MVSSSVSVKVITWEGVFAVDKAASLREELMAALESSSQVVVSVSMLDYLDLSIIQLLKSAAMEASRQGKTFHLTGTLKPEVQRILTMAGFLHIESDSAREIEAELLGKTKEQPE